MERSAFVANFWRRQKKWTLGSIEIYLSARFLSIEMRIRALTYFIELFESDFPSKGENSEASNSLAVLFDDAKLALDKASQALVSGGYDVQTVRITLNPFEEWLNTEDWGFEAVEMDENGDNVITPGKNKSMLLALEAQLTRIDIDFCSLGGVSSDNAMKCIPDILAMSPKFSCSASINSNQDTAATSSIAVAPDMAKCLTAAQTCLDVAQRVGNVGNFRYAVGFDCDGRTPFFPCSSYNLPRKEVKDGDDGDNEDDTSAPEEGMYAFNYTESSTIYNNSKNSKRMRPCGISVGLENGDLLFLSNYGATDYNEATSNMREVMKQCLLPIQKIMLEVCDSLNGPSSGNNDDTSDVYLRECTLDFFGIDASLNPGLELTESVGAGIENLLFLSTLPTGSTAGASPASLMQVQKGPEVYFGQFGTLSAVSSMTAALKSLQREYTDGMGAIISNNDNTDTSKNKESNVTSAIEEDCNYSYASNIGLIAEEQSSRDTTIQTLRLIGYCGLMLPVMEDAVLAARAAESPPTFTLRDLLAFSSICGVGLDTVPIAGNSNIEQIASVYLETGSLAYRLKKPLSCRLLPWEGAQVGEVVTVPPDMPYLIDTKAFCI